MSKSSTVLRAGLMVGLIGFASVAIFYALFDLLAARAGLHTVDLLGKTMFGGLRDTSVLGLPIEQDMATILLYSGFHLVTSLIIGYVVVWLIAYSRDHPARSNLISFLIVSGFFVTIIAIAILTEPIRPLLPTWSIVAANALSVIIAGTWLVKRYPTIWKRLSPLVEAGA